MRTMAYSILLLALALSQPAELIHSAFRLLSLAFKLALGG